MTTLSETVRLPSADEFIAPCQKFSTRRGLPCCIRLERAGDNDGASAPVDAPTGRSGVHKTPGERDRACVVS